MKRHEQRRQRKICKLQREKGKRQRASRDREKRQMDLTQSLKDLKVKFASAEKEIVDHRRGIESFLEKSLAHARGEWEAVSKKNQDLLEELERLRSLTGSGNSKSFAAWVSLKEQNASLANQVGAQARAERYSR